MIGPIKITFQPEVAPASDELRERLVSDLTAAIREALDEVGDLNLNVMPDALDRVAQAATRVVERYIESRPVSLVITETT